MDEYNLAKEFLDFTEIQNETISIDDFHRIPFADLTGLGGAIAELVPRFRTAMQTVNIPTEGLYRAINPKTGEVMPKLMYRSKQVADAYIGSMKQDDGGFDQTAFIPVSSVKEVRTTVAAINPATLMLAAGIVAMSRKLDAIEENQKIIVGFLEKEKESKLKGNLAFLLNAFKAYKTNWNNSVFKLSQHIKTQDIKQESEQSILFYRSMIRDDRENKEPVVSKADVKRKMQKLIESFRNYRLAIYLYSFASYLEIVLLENFGAEFLKTVSSKICEESFKYVELYTETYMRLENMVDASLETGAIKGAAIVSRGLGKAIEKIPLVERGQLDEHLITASKKLEQYKEKSIVDFLASFRTLRNCQVKQFVDLIETIDKLHNAEASILIDDENLYIKLAS